MGGMIGGGIVYSEDISRLMDDILEGTPIASSPITPAQGGTTGNANSISVSSAEEGLITADGATLAIPAGAVPVMDDGNPGTMIFSIEVDETQRPTLPEEFQSAGKVYRLGPEGFVFSSPIQLMLPIPQDIDPNQVLGLTYYDPQDNIWKMMPGTVDEGTRTVSAPITHFSPWSIFYDNGTEWAKTNGGWFEVNNNHSRGQSSYPDARNLPMSTSYGVCIVEYTLDNPANTTNWQEPHNWIISAEDGDSTKYWLPAGNYDLIEVHYLSEINHDPLYVPAYTSFWRSIGVSRLNAGETINFDSPSPTGIAGNSQYTEGRPPCWGAMTTSVGTGDIQITLTWHEYADIDLYVEDPNGEIIYYGSPYSSSGGALDRDNTCGNYITSQPENIFWPANEALSGLYRVSVEYYGDCGDAGSVEWTIRTVVNGVVQTYTGTLASENEGQEVTTFTIP